MADFSSAAFEETTYISSDEHLSFSDEPRDEPFYIVDLGDVCRKVKLWRLMLPRVNPFYAVKCNPLPEILQTLAHFGLGFDCASKGEIDTVLDLTDVGPERIIYANPCKTRSYIKHARMRSVRRMTFDNKDELRKIAEVFPNAELVLRIKVDDSGSLMKFSAKFGADLNIVPELLASAQALGLNVVGVSFHVGSGCCNPKCFSDAIANARWVFNQAPQFGFNMTLLDLGGGFPGHTGCEKLFERCAIAINQQLDKSFPEGIFSAVEIIAEPGRFMAASALTLFTTVIAKRKENDSCFAYYLNDGVYGSFNCKIFDHNDPVPVVAAVRQARPDDIFNKQSDSCGEPSEPSIAPAKATCEPSYTSVLWGPTCDSLDKVHTGVQLPELQVGDWLFFRDMGAYTCSAASDFNGFTKPTFFFNVSDSTKLILSSSAIGRKLLTDLPTHAWCDPSLKVKHAESEVGLIKILSAFRRNNKAICGDLSFNGVKSEKNATSSFISIPREVVDANSITVPTPAKILY